jgi:hypothetical protein
MAEAQGATRTNISIPRKLKSQMDAVSESVNWSAVACTAFGRKLAELNARKGDADMGDVIARLKAADEEDSSEAVQEGRAAGESWAREDARPKELRRLMRFWEQQEGARFHLEYAAKGAGIAKGLWNFLHPGEEGDWRDAEEFWEMTLGEGCGEKIEDVDYAYGFIDGATDVWDKVKDEL